MMKKSLLCLSLGLLVAGGVQAQQTVYSEDFNSTSGTSLPSGWTANPSANTAWKTGNQASAGSTYFSPPDIDGRFAIINDDGAGQGAVNDDSKLITKSYDLSSQTSIYASMDVAYLGVSGTLQDGTPVAEKLTFEASTDGGNTWTVLKTFTGNSSTWWEARYIDLSSVAGQSNVEFMWRYSDDNQWMYGAAVDNFNIFVPAANDIQLASVSPAEGETSSYGAVGSQITISGAVFNNGTSAISSYTVNYQQGNNPVVSTSETANIPAFTTDSFNNITFSVPSVGDFPIKVWVTLNGDNNHVNDSADAYVVGVSFLPTKRVVFEEATGTWCGWCPRGAVGMDELSAQFPDSTTQIAVHNGDYMMNQDYDSYIGTFISGYPSIVVDRKYVGDPGDILSQYDQFKSDFGYADIELGTPTVSGTSVSLPVTINPAVDIANAKLALIVTESNVRHTDASNPPSSQDTVWMQHNYYSPNMNGGPNQGGNIQAPLTGFDHASEYVDGMYYHFVGRAGFPSPQGGTISGIPSNMTAGSTYNATLTGTLDASWNQANLQYDVLLIAADGSIMNSAATATPTLLPILQDTVDAGESISNIQLGINHMELFPNPVSGSFATLSCNLSANTSLTIRVVDVTGKVVYSKTSQLNIGDNKIQIPTENLSNGTYFVTSSSEKGSATIKFVVNK